MTSKKNGLLGGRPPKAVDMHDVVLALIQGFSRLVKTEQPTESVESLATKRMINQARHTVAGYEEVIAVSRIMYLKNLEKLNQPNTPEGQKILRTAINAHARELMLVLRMLAVKAEVLLQNLTEQGIAINKDTETKLKHIAELDVKSLDKVVALVLGVVEETLDQFGIPILS